jgi:uncharacterized protein (TIGR03435 family)
MIRATLTLLLSYFLGLAPPSASPQSAVISANLPSFDAATIKPRDPTARARPVAGFYGQPGGRIFYGGDIKILVECAFDLQDYQVAGGPGWLYSQQFEINAVPPENSPSRTLKGHNKEPTVEQRLMLQSLLRDRFGFKSHIITKDGTIYLLTRGSKPLQLRPPEDTTADPRAIVIDKGGIIDGEALGTNTTIDYLAQRLGRYLRIPVLNETGITGSYDFHLPPNDPENQDIFTAVRSVVDRLGLKIKRGRGPIQTLVIDEVKQPSEN